MKLCSTCKASKPYTEFHRCASKADGHYSQCKPCASAKSKAWYEANKVARAVSMKVWNEANKESLAAATRRYRERHPEKIAAANERDAEQKRLNNRAWYERNKEAKRAANREWSKKNPARHCANVVLRKLRVQQACPAWADRDAIAAVYERARALQEQTGTEHHVDHIVPIKGEAVCGLHVHWNLQVLPGVDNRRKFNHHDTFTSGNA